MEKGNSPQITPINTDFGVSGIDPYRSGLQDIGDSAKLLRCHISFNLYEVSGIGGYFLYNTQSPTEKLPRSG